MHFFIKYIDEKKTQTKYEINKIMSIQSKDFYVCQKSRDSTAVSLLIIFFLEAKNSFLISKCRFNGHRTFEHEENVVRIVN